MFLQWEQTKAAGVPAWGNCTGHCFSAAQSSPEPLLQNALPCPAAASHVCTQDQEFMQLFCDINSAKINFFFPQEEKWVIVSPRKEEKWIIVSPNHISKAICCVMPQTETAAVTVNLHCCREQGLGWLLPAAGLVFANPRHSYTSSASKTVCVSISFWLAELKNKASFTSSPAHSPPSCACLCPTS